VNTTTLLGSAFKFHVVTRDQTLTGHAGTVLLRDFIHRLGLPELIDQHLHLKGRERGYPESQSLLALCWNLILGGDSLRDLDVLRGDAGLHELLGVEAILAPTMAGEFLRHFSLGAITALHGVLRRAAEVVRPWQPSRQVTLDIDASLYSQSSQRKDGSHMNYKGEVGYYPLFCFWAEEGELVFSHLLRGNARAITRAEWFLAEVLRRIPPEKKRYLRADSEFYNWDFIALCEAEQITYAITADQTKQLKAVVAAVPEQLWRHFAGAAQVAEFVYAPTRRAAHRYIVKRTPATNAQGACCWTYHVVVTNDSRRSPKKLLKWFYQRCAMENLIKEHKHDFGLEKLPTQRFQANWAWLLMGQLAWNIVAWFKRLCLPPHCHTQTVKTLRHRMLKVAGKIVHQSRQLFLVLSEEYLFKELWRFALNKLGRLVLHSP
jgi:hypothetical protein